MKEEILITLAGLFFLVIAFCGYAYAIRHEGRD